MYGSQVAEVKPGLTPCAVDVCEFNNPRHLPLVMSGTPGEVYLGVALTKLENSTGMFGFCPAADSNRARADRVEEHRLLQVELNIGDALIWRGECIIRQGYGGGGLMLVVTYRR